MSAEGRTSVVERSLAALMLLAMVIGGFGLLIGVPAATLWLIGKVPATTGEHLLLALLAVPSAMVIFGFLLFRLNRAYLQLRGYEISEPDEEGEWRPRQRGPLDRILVIWAVVAVVGLFAWTIFGDTVTGPVAPY